MQILINGIQVNLNDFDGTEQIVFNYQRKQESGESGLSFAPELIVAGETFTLLYNLLINQPNPELTQATFDVYDDCCVTDAGDPVYLFKGIVNGKDVNWCEFPNCQMTITVLDNSEDAQALACLKNIFPWDKKPAFGGGALTLGEDTFRTAPKMDYCIDVRPGFLQEILFIFSIILIFALSPIILLVGTIISLVNNEINGFLFLFDEISKIITGCGFKHKTPFVHSYMRNMCDICGLNFQSSIFGPSAPYHNTVRMDAAFKPGRKLDVFVLRAYEENKPNLNGLQFLDEFKQFNMDWKVSGNALIIERKDYFSGGVWVDTEQLADSEIIEICFDALEDPVPAFAEYQYNKDGVDNTGDETNPNWVEKAIDWNSPPNPSQRGLYSVNFNYSTAQFREDSGRDDVSALDKPFYKSVFTGLNDFEGTMLMERGVCNFPRLLMWDSTSGLDNGRVVRYPSIVDDTYDYNIDWWVKLNYQDGNGVFRDTLYQRFLEIDNPRVSGIKRRGYTLKFSVIGNGCQYIKGLDVYETDKLDKLVRLRKGGTYVLGTIETIEYNWSRLEITVTGKV